MTTKHSLPRKLESRREKFAGQAKAAQTHLSDRPKKANNYGRNSVFGKRLPNKKTRKDV